LRFEAGKIEIEKLHKSMEKGDIELAFYDETGLNPTSLNQDAWTAKGKTHCCEAKRGKRLNVLGAMLSSGKLVSYVLDQTTVAMDFLDFLAHLMTTVRQTISKPLVVILDNASIHKAKAIEPMLKILEEQGLRLYFLPPYSPELNRIEILWRKIKYEWLTFKNRDTKTLRADLNEILDNFGTKYQLSFQSH
jgi:transposase